MTRKRPSHPNIMLIAVLLVTLVVPTRADEFADNGSDESLRNHRQNKDGFHTHVSADEADNGFSYKAKSDKPHRDQNSVSTPYGGSRDKPVGGDRQIVTGIPDLSDPCFRRYANSIIVNAQPYERRSSISLLSCKTQCLQSQIGVYSCRSFVYDNINQVCDLFAHVGDQAPARLLRFQTRDYFEPTAAISCNADALILSTSAPNQSPTGTSEYTEPQSILKEQEPLGSSLAEFENAISQPIIPRVEPEPTPSRIGESCEGGKSSRFLKTLDFELVGNDDVIVDGVSLDECVDFCARNIAPNQTDIKCNSFEFSNNRCVMATETAVPLGNGQLRQLAGTDYFEKVCVDNKLANECPSIYNRYPQMILVGFAETVVDAPSLQHCFDNCINSKKLYGFRCISGMYYFEEPQLNCILNTEDQHTQPDLFTSENADLVDYFETGCNFTVSAVNRRFASPSSGGSSVFSSKRHDFVEEDKQSLNYGWSEWSPCGGNHALQQRTKICAQGKICGRQSRPCETTTTLPPPTPESVVTNYPSISEVLQALKRSSCPYDKCCPIFGNCKIGIVQLSATKRIEWCDNPCPKQLASGEA